MYIKVGTNAVLMKGFDAATFESESSKGIGKLKSIGSFFRGVSISRDTVQTFIETHPSKLAKKLDERLVAYDKDLKKSRVNPRQDEIEIGGHSDMKVYDFIRNKYMKHEMGAELAKLRNLSSDEVLVALQRSGLFEDSALVKIARLGVDLEGSPHW